MKFKLSLNGRLKLIQPFPKKGYKNGSPKSNQLLRKGVLKTFKKLGETYFFLKIIFRSRSLTKCIRLVITLEDIDS